MSQAHAEMLRSALRALGDPSKDELDAALASFRTERVPAGAYFARMGEAPERLAFIASGLFRVYFISDKCEERTLAFRGEGRFISGARFFLKDAPPWFSIQAIEDSTILSVGVGAAFNGEVAACWRTLYAKYMEMLYLEKEERERQFLSEDAESRYRRFMAAYPGLEGRVAQYHIASFLGITPVALSRIRKSMKASAP